MATEAHLTFETNLERAAWFLDIQEWGHGGGRGAPIMPLRELPRGAVSGVGQNRPPGVELKPAI